jgi:hypothetical protein
MEPIIVEYNETVSDILGCKETPRPYLNCIIVGDQMPHSKNTDTTYTYAVYVWDIRHVVAAGVAPRNVLPQIYENMKPKYGLKQVHKANDNHAPLKSGDCSNQCRLAIAADAKLPKLYLDAIMKCYRMNKASEKPNDTATSRHYAEAKSEYDDAMQALTRYAKRLGISGLSDDLLDYSKL